MFIPYYKQGEIKAVQETLSSSDCHALALAPPATSTRARANPAVTPGLGRRQGGGLLAQPWGARTGKGAPGAAAPRQGGPLPFPSPPFPFAFRIMES